MPESRRLHAYVSGRVQGVAFRWYTVREAQRLTLSGQVRNLADGRVEIIAEGDQQQLNAMLDWVRKGSPGSRVVDVQYELQPATSEFDGFTVAR